MDPYATRLLPGSLPSLWVSELSCGIMSSLARSASLAHSPSSCLARRSCSISRKGWWGGWEKKTLRPGAHGDLGVRGAFPRGPHELGLLPGQTFTQPGKGHPSCFSHCPATPFTPSSSSLSAAFPAALAGGDPSPVLLELPASLGGPSGQGLALGHL